MKMKSLRLLPLHAALAGAFLLAVGAARSQVIYHETFTAAGNETLAAYGGGWKGYAGGTAVDVTANAPNVGDGVSVGGVSGPSGWLSINNASTAGQVFAAVDTITSLTVANGSTISWNMGNANAGNVVRLLVQVGGSWYASAATFSNTAGTVFTSGATFTAASDAGTAPSFNLTFSTAASGWKAFTLTPAGEITLGTTPGSNLSSNDITGIGFYVTSANAAGQATRIDNLAINAVPEAPTPALLLFGLLGGGLFLRRRSVAA